MDSGWLTEASERDYDEPQQGENEKRGVWRKNNLSFFFFKLTPLNETMHIIHTQNFHSVAEKQRTRRTFCSLRM